MRVDLPGIGPRTFQVEGAGEQDQALELLPAAALRIAAPGAESVRLLDAAGAGLPARGPLGTRERFEVHDGRLPVLEAPAEARWLVLEHDGLETRVPLCLAPGDHREVLVERP
jgi:hypothetical protein